MFVLVLLALTALPSAGRAQPVPSPPSSAQNPPGFDEALNEGNLLLRQRNYEQAIRVFKRANGMKNNASADCLLGMAQAYNRMGAFKDAIDACERVVQLAGDDRKTIASAWNLRGLSLSSTDTGDRRDKKKCAEAEAAFRKALEANPDLNVAHFNIGMMLMRQEQDAAGTEELKRYLERDPKGGYVDEARRMIENPRRAREKFAPDFSIVTGDGRYLNSDELRGKVIVLDFWASWCRPCVDSLDDVIRFARRHEKEAVVLISVSSDTDQAKWSDFLARNPKMTWPQHFDARGVLNRAFGVRAIPTYVVIDQEGIVRRVALGANRFNEVYDAVKECLKNQAGSK